MNYYIPSQHAPYKTIGIAPVLVLDSSGDVIVGSAKYRQVAACEKFPSGLFRALIDGKELDRHGYKRNSSSIFNWVNSQSEVVEIVEKYYKRKEGTNELLLSRPCE